jgi:isopenicillin N synthase-like dioxygenase
MILENVDVAKQTFTLKFSDSDVVHMNFGADKYGYTEMRVEVTKRDEDGKFMEGYNISYHWDSSKEEAPAFVMDMMSLLHKLGKIGSAAASGDEVVETPTDMDAPTPETRAAEEAAEEEVEEDPEGD